MSTCKRMQIDSYISPCTKLKSKWTKDLNVSPATLNLISTDKDSFPLQQRNFFLHYKKLKTMKLKRISACVMHNPTPPIHNLNLHLMFIECGGREGKNIVRAR